MCGVAVVGVLLAAAVVLEDDGGIDHPDEWDERVVDLVAFVEQERGLSFEHPVTVEFLTEEQYSDSARVDEGTLADEDREAMEDSGTVLEALGLVPAETDLMDTSNEMADTGTLAFYDPITETVTVRGTEMTTGLEVTLVHELVHVAQDQAFDLEQTLADESAGAYEAFRALVEGDASRIEMSYVDTLDSDEQDAYWDDYTAEVDESEAGLSEVPAALQALFAAPYVFGQPMVDLIAHEGGNGAVDDAFADPPRSAEHLFDPRSYFADDAPVEVAEPELPDGADPVSESGPLGATTLFVMLSERIDPLTALGAADGWGGDMSAAYRDDDRTCVRVDLVGDSAEDTSEIADALQAWSDAGPVGVATVDETSDGVSFESCAGGADGEAAAASSGRSLDALALPATRSQLMVMAARDGGLDHDEAFAIGDCFVRHVPFETITEANESTEPSAEVTAVIDDAIAGCMVD